MTVCITLKKQTNTNWLICQKKLLHKILRILKPLINLRTVVINFNLVFMSRVSGGFVEMCKRRNKINCI